MLSRKGDRLMISTTDIENKFIRGYARELAIRVLQSDLYVDNPDAAEFADRILELTTDKDFPKAARNLQD